MEALQSDPSDPLMQSVLQQAQTLVGTSLYMSPEIFRKESFVCCVCCVNISCCDVYPLYRYGLKADTFALGVIAYELVTLKWPFGSHDGKADPQKVLHAPDPAKPPNVSPQYWSLVTRMLSRVWLYSLFSLFSIYICIYLSL